MQEQKKQYKYKLVVDNGKPSETELFSDAELKHELFRLKMSYVAEDCPHFDIFVYDSAGADISDTEFILSKIRGGGQ